MNCYNCEEELDREDISEVIDLDDTMLYVGELCKKCLKLFLTHDPR